MTEFEQELLVVLKSIDRSLVSLGVNDADTRMGALELVASKIDMVSESIDTNTLKIEECFDMLDETLKNGTDYIGSEIENYN